jgi:proline iminopeptidase
MSDNTFGIDTGSGVISGVEAGDGPPLLLLHGGPGLSDYMGLLAAETVGWRALRYQQRGMAPSTLEGPLSVQRHVADAIAVLDGLDMPEAVVLGHSWGGHLALQLAVAAPRRVTGLVLVDSLGAAGPDAGISDLGQALPARLPAAALARLGELAGQLGDRMPTDAEATEQLALLWSAYFAVPEHAPPPPAGLAVSVAGNMETLGSVAESLADGFAGLLAGVSVPVVFVLGEQSPMPLSQGRQTAALLPAAEVVVVPAAGHLPWHEQPGCVADALARVGALGGVQ